MGRTRKISRREAILRGFLGIGALWVTSSVTPPIFGAEALDYENLSVTLFPKTEKEKDYLKRIASQVRKGELPRKLVYAAWQYATKKAKTRRVIYFDSTLAILCKRAGVKLTVRLDGEEKKETGKKTE